MLKRLLDILVSLGGLVVSLPLLVVCMVVIWCQDWHSPFYIAPRAARGGGTFPMIKFRSMVVRADSTGVDSTAAGDRRITAIGRFLRRTKLDEVPQLLNVLLGHMSLVGPRPNVKREVDIYTQEERRLLTVRPGITDLSSIVFSDEGDILRGSDDPDLKYNQVIRPWKSRLGLMYVDHRSMWLDVRILALTLVNAVARKASLAAVHSILSDLGSSVELLEVAARRGPLPAAPPPGATSIVTDRSEVAV